MLDVTSESLNLQSHHNFFLIGLYFLYYFADSFRKQCYPIHKSCDWILRMREYNPQLPAALVLWSTGQTL